MVTVVSLVVDDASSIVVRPGLIDVDGAYITPVSFIEAEALATRFGELAAQMRATVARKMTDPEPDGPLAVADWAPGELTEAYGS